MSLPSLITVAARGRGGGCNGPIHGTGLQTVPPRRNEALPERRALLHGEVPGGDRSPASGNARNAPGQEDFRLRHPIEGEAAAEAAIRASRRAVQIVLRSSVEEAR